MNPRVRAAGIVVVVSSLGALTSAGCDTYELPGRGTGGQSGQVPSGVGGNATSVCEGGTVLGLTDSSNYSLTTTMDVGMSVLKSSSDLLIDWTNLSVDFFDDPVSASADIQMVLLSLWQMSPEEIEEKLSTDTLNANDQKGVLSIYPDGTFTSRNLFTFNALDRTNTPIPEEDIRVYLDTGTYPPASYTFLAIAQAGTSPGQDARMLRMFKLDDAAVETTLSLDNSSTLLTAQASFAAAVPVQLPPSVPDLSVNWGGMMVNALGNPFLPTQITKAVVAHFETETLQELEGDFLHLEDRADRWYEGSGIAGTSIDLSTLTDSTAGAFPGVDAEGLWLLALFCTKQCNNPAPWAIAILKPCDPVP